MKIKKLNQGLELRHSGDGFTLSFIPANGKGGALLNMTQIAHERGAITGSKINQVMNEVIDDESSFDIQNERLKVIIAEREETIDSLNNVNNPAVAAIEYALKDDYSVEFLRLWNEGEFDEIRSGWDNVPDEVFIGADPLFGI